jgi:hypothetical protein
MKRVTVVVAIGVVGEEEDLKKFVEVMRADFERRSHMAAREIFHDRIEILPIPPVEDGI